MEQTDVSSSRTIPTTGLLSGSLQLILELICVLGALQDHTVVDLPPILNHRRGTAQLQFTDGSTGIEVVLQMTPNQADVPVAQGIAQPRGSLPGEVGIAGTRIKVEREKQAAAVAQTDAC